VVFAPDGQTLATGGDDGAVRLWDVADPARARSLGQPLAHAPDLVDAVAFAPDGRTLAVGHGPEAGGEGSVVLWDVSDRSAPRVLGRPLTGHDSAFAVAFSPDGRTLATGGGDRTVVLWDLSALTELRAHAVDHACRITGRGLDRAEWDRYIPGLPYRDTCPR
jgi:WD40 repeat protein